MFVLVEAIAKCVCSEEKELCRIGEVALQVVLETATTLMGNIDKVSIHKHISHVPQDGRKKPSRFSKHSLSLHRMYCIAQNFGGVNFWHLVARHAIGGEKFGKSSKTGLLRIKNLAEKILINPPNLPKFCTIQ